MFKVQLMSFTFLLGAHCILALTCMRIFSRMQIGTYILIGILYFFKV